MASTDDSPRAAGAVMASGPGSILAGRYRIDARLGRSKLGELVRAEDLEHGRPVAVRLVPPELSGGDDLFARLELRCARNLRLPRGDAPLLVDLVDLLDLGRDAQGRLFLVTDLFPASSLADELARGGPPPWQRLRDLLVRACQIVHLSHEHGMIRQDLSTSSLYPVRDKNDPGTLKVVSPGLMVASGGRVWSCAEPDSARLLARYAAPEQISTGVVDRRTDVYALGVILYECLTGQVPFADPRPAHVLAAHLITPPAPFSAAVRRRIPAELEAIVARALAKSPDDRWPTVKALANAMAAIEVGRCEFSGVLDTGDSDDLTEHLEPQPSSTTMRVDAARLSGRAGLAPVDPSATGAHAWRDLVDAADSASGPPAASSSASLSRTSSSDSAITPSPEDSAPTLVYGLAAESASRWPAPAPASVAPAPAPRRLIAWLFAAGLSLVTAGVVSVALRPAHVLQPSPAAVDRAPASFTASPQELAERRPTSGTAGANPPVPADSPALARDPAANLSPSGAASPVLSTSPALDRDPAADPSPSDAASPVLSTSPALDRDPARLPSVGEPAGTDRSASSEWGSAAPGPAPENTPVREPPSPSDPTALPASPSVPNASAEVHEQPAPAARPPGARAKGPPRPARAARGSRQPDRPGDEHPTPPEPAAGAP